MFDMHELAIWDQGLAALANARHLPQDRSRPETAQPRPSQPQPTCPFAHQRSQG